VRRTRKPLTAPRPCPYNCPDTMTRAAATRLEFRIRPEAKQRIQQAADLLALPVGDFVRSAAEIRAEQVIRNNASTLVPVDFFDALLRALDQSARPNAALKRAARRRRTVLQPR
jgi:uncharacterized protein (DUF1778 family)